MLIEIILFFSGKLLEYAKEQEANGNSIEETVSSLPTPDVEIADSLQRPTSNTQCGIHNKYSEERRRGNNQPWALKIIGNRLRDYRPYNLLICGLINFSVIKLPTFE